MPKPVRQPINRDKYVGGRCSSIMDAMLDSRQITGIKIVMLRPNFGSLTWAFVTRYPRRHPRLMRLHKYSKNTESGYRKFLRLKKPALRKADSLKSAANHRRFERMFPLTRKSHDF